MGTKQGIIYGFSLALIYLVQTVAVKAEESSHITPQPDHIKQYMYTSTMPVNQMYATAKQKIMNSVKGQKNFNLASSCIKKHINVANDHQVMDIILSSYPGFYYASTLSSLYETAEGQKMMFFCGKHIGKLTPHIASHARGTAKQYLKVADAAGAAHFIK